MGKFGRLAGLCIVLLAALALNGCMAKSGGTQASATGASVSQTASETDGFQSPARVVGKDFCLLSPDGSYQPAFLNGVNMGAAGAGSFPGEFAITKEQYLRWFREISDMHVQVIRVYVNQMPAFYEALAAFNQTAENPLYLMQGVYLNEDLIAQYEDAFAGGGAIGKQFLSDIDNAVGMIHGDLTLDPQAGNAYGVYDADVSQWVIGWILGIEWSSDFVNGTDAANPDKTDFSGEYVVTRDASPFEVFLAQAAEEAVFCEMKQYGEQRPVAVCNWLTTDPLTHPNEPSPDAEDSATVDAEHLRATARFEAGFFASYHIYPYYPDFLSYEPAYAKTGDPYLACLEELAAYHTMPVLVAEYGIPSSRGIAHENTVTGISQGFASEQQQAEWLISMNRDIRKAGCAGGLIFSWQDEWFKGTWNTMDYEDAARRPYWHNVQSPEQCFGLLAFDSPAAVLDGSGAEWQGEEPVWEQDGISVYARADAAYLWLLVKADGYDFDRDTLYLPLDTLAGQGITSCNGVDLSDGAEFLLRLHGRHDSALLTDAYYDVFQYDYAEKQDYYETVPGELEKNSGSFDPIYLAMSKKLYLAATDETVPFERFETGALQYGCGDPENPEYYSLADFCSSGSTVEIRLPWNLIGFMDPSQKLVIGDFHSGSEIASAVTEGVRVGAFREGGTGPVTMKLYAWDNWSMPAASERLKQSYGLLQDYFSGQN